MQDKRNDNENIIDDILNNMPEKPSPEEEEAVYAFDPGAEIGDAPDADIENCPEEDAADTEVPDYTESLESIDGEDVNFPLDNEDFDDAEIEYAKNFEDETKPRVRKAPKKSKRKIVKKRKTGLGLAFALIRITLIVSISVVLSILIISMGREYLGMNKSDRTVMVTIPTGSTTVEIIDILYEHDIIKSKQLFKVIAKLNKADASYQAGNHILRPNMSYSLMIDVLTDEPLNSEYDSVTVTFPEGIDLYSAAKKLEDEGVVSSAEKFIFYFNSKEFITDDYKFASLLTVGSNRKFYAMEGYLFPDTYTFYKNTDDMDDEKIQYSLACRKIYENFDKKIEPYIERIGESDLTLDELITLASIVQSEAPTKDDMKNVASVFYNRLNNPEGIGRTQPYLESDPTSAYANDVIRAHIEKTVSSELVILAYDTYQVAGLPPGAICNPGTEAIESVLYPAVTEYYYFCSNIYTRETLYAGTLEEHNQNLEIIQQQYDDMPVEDEGNGEE